MCRTCFLKSPETDDVDNNYPHVLPIYLRKQKLQKDELLFVAVPLIETYKEWKGYSKSDQRGWLAT